MAIRIAAIEVSHWHAVYDAAYLHHLIAMPDVELVAIQDSDADLVAKRAAKTVATGTTKVAAGNGKLTFTVARAGRYVVTLTLSGATGRHALAWRLTIAA